MSYAEQIRAQLAGRTDVVEKRMFGGIAFMVAGKLAIAASAQGGVLVRVDPAEAAQLVESGAARAAVMRGRRMKGWVRADPTADELPRWIARGVAQARDA